MHERRTRARILGIGVDVVDVARLDRSRQGSGDVLEHVCRPEELEGGVDADRAAVLWSGKEAVAKSIGTGLWQSGVGWRDICVARNGSVSLYGQAAVHAAGSRVELAFARRGPVMMAVALRREST